MPDPNTCGNEYAALTGSPYAPRFKEQAYVAEINQLLARVAELEIQNLGLSEQAIKDRREAGELRARVAELEAQVAEIPDLLLIAHMQGAEQAKDQIQALRAQISALDCRLVGRVADLSGSHCPADRPCDRCVSERRIEELSHAYVVQGLALEDLTAERDRYREALEKLLPKQDPIDAECVCDYCGASLPWDEAQNEHKPGCPWLLIHPKA